MSSTDPAYVGAILAGAMILLAVSVVAYLIMALFLMYLFRKAGVQGSWRAWVPVYNVMIFAKLGDLSPWVALIAIGVSGVLGAIPVIGPIFAALPVAVMAVSAWRIGLKLQKSSVWVLLWIFLAPVWLVINAFDGSRWNTAIAPAPWAGNTFFADSTVWEGIPPQRG